MLTLRTLAIVIIGAGVFAGLPLTDAQACDDDYGLFVPEMLRQ